MSSYNCGCDTSLQQLLNHGITSTFKLRLCCKLQNNLNYSDVFLYHQLFEVDVFDGNRIEISDRYYLVDIFDRDIRQILSGRYI